ncbi:hypothetical protein IA69_29565 [Massilia sp. JS1662]|nr:hypothetical protein IA69_29565 [Massilia sp. JS1662]
MQPGHAIDELFNANAIGLPAYFIHIRQFETPANLAFDVQLDSVPTDQSLAEAFLVITICDTIDARLPSPIGKRFAIIEFRRRNDFEILIPEISALPFRSLFERGTRPKPSNAIGIRQIEIAGVCNIRQYYAAAWIYCQ